MIHNSTTKNISKIDGRTLLFLTVASCLVSFLSTDLLGHAIYTTWLFLLISYLGFFKRAVKYFAIYLVTVGWIMIANRYHFTFPSPLFISMIYKVILPAMPASLLGSIPFGKLTAGIRKLPLPSKVQMIAIIMLRFGPTVIHEMNDVKDSMRVRGFLGSAKKVLCHPMQTLEYAFVPLVIRSIKIADELAASASVRGIESPYAKQSYFISKISILDIGIMALTLLIGASAFMI